MAFAESKCPQVLKSASDVSLSRRAVVRRVEDMFSDIKYQIKVKVNDLEYYLLALNESTDIRNTTQLAVFIRTVDKDFNVLEELIDVNAMNGTTCGINIFESLQSSLQKFGIKNFIKCISVATDSTPSMVGCHNGLIAKVRELKPDVLALLCIINQENLSAKAMDMEHIDKSTGVLPNANDKSVCVQDYYIKCKFVYNKNILFSHQKFNLQQLVSHCSGSAGRVLE